MRIAILGAGSLGCVFGGMLSEAGHDVVLINRNRALVEKLGRDGLVLRTKHGDRTVAVRAAVDCNGLSPVDLLVVLVKSFHTREALEAAGDAIGPDTLIMSLQNGLGHEEIISDFAAAGNALIGKTYVGGTTVSPGVVVAGTEGKRTMVGDPIGGRSERAKQVADVFQAVGLETEASSNIMQVIWDKLLVNVSTGALSAISRLPYGELYRVAEVEACAVEAVQEAMAVAHAAGIALSISDARSAWLLAGEGLPPEFKASMLQSLEKGSRTEIDFINGAVVAWGRRYAVPTPVNRTLVAAVKGIERATEVGL